MIKKKVAIVTIISKNYGNRLQNFALQEYLRGLNLDVYTLPYKSKISIRIKEKIKLYLIYVFEYCRNRWVWENFNREYIKWAPLESNDRRMNSSYDFFIAGSDQIWNPLFWINSEREFLTHFDRKKRIAYAASIGIDQLPNEYVVQYKRRFNGIRHISVREDKASDIIYALTGRRVPVVIDPTMLLKKEKWETWIRSCKISAPKKYVVTYFLGTGKQDYQKYIRERARKEGLEVIELLDENGNAKRKIGPLEFVYYIANSEFTYVDSFHGAVFSILFSKPFVVFQRPFEEGAGVMSSRLETLLSTFKLKNRLIKSLVQLEGIDNHCDFTKVEDILSAKREEARKFLREALNLKEDDDY